MDSSSSDDDLPIVKFEKPSEIEPEEPEYEEYMFQQAVSESLSSNRYIDCWYTIDICTVL